MKKSKAIARVEEAFETFKGLRGSSEMIFTCEKQRVQLALIIQLLGLIVLSLLRDPAQRICPPRVLTEFTFKYTKQYQCEKDQYVNKSASFRTVTK